MNFNEVARGGKTWAEWHEWAKHGSNGVRGQNRGRMAYVGKTWSEWREWARHGPKKYGKNDGNHQISTHF